MDKIESLQIIGKFPKQTVIINGKEAVNIISINLNIDAENIPTAIIKYMLPDCKEILIEEFPSASDAVLSTLQRKAGDNERLQIENNQQQAEIWRFQAEVEKLTEKLAAAKPTTCGECEYLIDDGDDQQLYCEYSGNNTERNCFCSEGVRKAVTPYLK